jgi:hypothetical protein
MGIAERETGRFSGAVIFGEEADCGSVKNLANTMATNWNWALAGMDMGETGAVDWGEALQQDIPLHLVQPAWQQLFVARTAA